VLFNSQAFILVFLPLVAVAYYLAGGRRGVRQWLLIGASVLFYAYWDWRFLPLLLGSVAVNWLLAGWMGGLRPGRVAALGIGVNLGILGVFKYLDFVVGSIAPLADWELDRFNIILPLGISFFTFQQISYLVDRAAGKAPLYTFRDYALYVTFFPQLVAGPIVRHHEIIGQFAADPRRAGMEERIAKGGMFFVIGLVKKVLIADRLAQVADPLFTAANTGFVAISEAWLAALAFSLQIYFDFSGYSDMAIGLGLIFGFVLPANFASPYRAASIVDFWRRWHMTLSRFLRDYVYIPFGGSRRGPGRQVFAALATMLLGGLWHGAAWTFVAWGGAHGIALAINHAWRRRGYSLPPLLGWLATFVFVILAFVPFRAESFAAAWHILWPALGATGFEFVFDGLEAVRSQYLWTLPLALLLVLFGIESQRLVETRIKPHPVPAAAFGAALAAVVFGLGGPGGAEFIYFQF